MALRQKGPTLVGVLWMEVFLSLVILGARYYTRAFILRNMGWDDLLLAITWVSLQSLFRHSHFVRGHTGSLLVWLKILMAAFAGLCTASATYGMGVHASDLTFHQNTHGMLLLLAGQSVIAIAMGVSKCAVSAFLMRIVVNKW